MIHKERFISLRWLFLMVNISISFIFIISLVFIYFNEKKQIIQHLRNELEILVSNASLLFDANIVKNLNSKEDWKKKEYKSVYNILKTLVIMNSKRGIKENQIYLLKPLPHKNQTIFVAHLPGDSSQPYHIGNIELMADPEVNYIGHTYEFTPLMKKIFYKKLQVASTDIYTDEHGMWISAYAPIMDKQGEVVAILEVDHNITFIKQILYKNFYPIVFGILGISLILFALNFGISNLFLKPIFQLVEAIRYVENGNYRYRLLLPKKRLKNEFDILSRSFNSMVQSLEERVELARYVSIETLKKIQNETQDKKQISKKVHKIIIFTDIRNFTKFSWNRTPEEIVFVLNSILSKQSEIFEKYQGKIDKYVGDEIIVLMDPSEEKAFENSFYSILEIFKELKDIFEFYGISLGAGIHYGEILQGDIGSKTRKDFTIIGANVNLCARLCSGAKSYEVLLSQSMYEKLKDKFSFYYKGKAKLKGFQDPIPVYSYQWR